MICTEATGETNLLVLKEASSHARKRGPGIILGHVLYQAMLNLSATCFRESPMRMSPLCHGRTDNAGPKGFHLCSSTHRAGRCFFPSGVDKGFGFYRTSSTRHLSKTMKATSYYRRHRRNYKCIRVNRPGQPVNLKFSFVCSLGLCYNELVRISGLSFIPAGSLLDLQCRFLRTIQGRATLSIRTSFSICM